MDNETIYDNLEGHPEQPGPKLPRPIVVSHPLTAVSSGCLIIFGLVWTAIILVLLTIIVLEFMPELQTYWLLRNTGVATTAEVIDNGLIPQGDRAKPFCILRSFSPMALASGFRLALFKLLLTITETHPNYL